MNSIPPVSQAPRSSDPAQSEAPESAAQTSGTGADFAKALSDAGGKPSRKHTSFKGHDGAGGSPLPAPGNQSPPAPAIAPPAAAPTAAAPTAAALTVTPPASTPASPAPAPGTVKPADNGAPVAVVSGLGAAVKNSAAPSNAGQQDPGAQALADMAAALAVAAPANATPASATPSGGGAPAATNNPPLAKGNDAAAAPSVPATMNPKAAAVPAVASAPPAEPDTKSGETRSSKSEIAAATSGQTSADGSAAANDPVSTDGTAAADAAAQSVIAGTLAPDMRTSPDPASADDLATPDTGVAPQGIAAGNGAATPAPVLAAAAHVAVSPTAAGGAATAASFAQAMSASAGAGGVDKRHDNGTDGTPAGVSNDGSGGAAQLLTSNSSADAAPVPTLKVSAGVNSPDFGQGVAERVSLMMDSNLTSAKLQVNPPALGPIEVRIALQGGHAQVWLSSHSALTRDALESSAPKLREMLGSQGFGQVSVDISQRSFQERSPQPQPYTALPGLRELSGIPQSSVTAAHSPSGLLDAYA